MTPAPLVDPARFIWASGIEDTFIPQTRSGLRALDEYQLIGHYDHWREDLTLAQSLGVQAVRWGVPWYRVQPKPNRFDWRWTDEVIPFIVDTLEITPIIDLMHYGCPLWLQGEFAHADYPQRVADYAVAFAERYKSLVTWHTPLNEPMMNAWMCGARGVWPPYLRGESGFVRLMLQLARGIVETSHALKAVNPLNILAHVDVLSVYYGQTVAEKQHATFLNARTRLCYDLITGSVNESHELWPYLRQHGASEAELHALRARPAPLDVMGLNFYPQWSSRQVGIDSLGRRYTKPVLRDGSNFADLLRDYYHRYGVPVMVTETSAFGAHERRLAWLNDSLAAIQTVRKEGVPVIGYTWFPMFTMVAWPYRTGTKPASDYYIDLGLFQLNTTLAHARARWVETPLATDYRRWIDAGFDS